MKAETRTLLVLLANLAAILLSRTIAIAEASSERLAHRVVICKDGLWSFGPAGREIVATALTTVKGELRETIERCAAGKSSALLSTASGDPIGEALFTAERNDLTVSISVPGTEGLVLTLQDSGESYFGLTEHPPANRKLDNRGAVVSYGPISHPSRANARSPFFFTSRGAALYVSRGDPLRYELGVEGATRIHIRGEEVELRVLAGADYRSIMKWQNVLVGPTVVPPSWALGPLWWRDDPHEAKPPGQEAILTDAEKIRGLGLAASGIWIDRPYGTGPLGWGNFDFSPSYPSPASMISELSGKGLPTLLWIANRASGRMYKEGKLRGFLFRGSEEAWPAMDLRRPDAAAWLRSELEELARTGARGFKIDRGDEKEMPSAAVNEMAALLPRIASEALRAVHGEDHFVFARNIAGPGRRYAGVWSGDPEASFDGLRLALIHGLRSALAGFPLWGSDTGGYIGSPGEELHTRWLAFSAFTPMMEILVDHGPAIWSRFGERHLSALRRYSVLHSRLVPYIHSELADSARSGFPVMRPMLLEWPGLGWEGEWTQYMLGRYLLVAPVLEQGAKGREVRFPPGRWLSLSTPGGPVQGPVALQFESPPGEIPVFLREGAIVPWKADDGSFEPSFYPANGVDSRFPLLIDGRATREISMRVEGREVEIELPDLGARARSTVHCKAPEGIRLSGGTVVDSSPDRLVFESNGPARVYLRCHSLFAGPPSAA